MTKTISKYDEEKKFLDSLVVDYRDQSPYSKVKKDVINGLMMSWVKDSKKKTVLQLGCSGGYETEFLAKNFGRVDVIDGSKKFIDNMKANNPYKNVNFIYSLFEEYDFLANNYDYIVCNYILEHVLNPAEVVGVVRKSLKLNGLIFATVPNSNAFSRRLAKEMGLIKDLEALTENDHRHGHRRVYDKQKLEENFVKVGYKIVNTQGVIFKILADFQLNKMFEVGVIGDEHIFGLQKMAKGNDEFCDSIFLVAKR